VRGGLRQLEGDLKNDPKPMVEKSKDQFAEIDQI
jgi:hypothetical protein